MSDVTIESALAERFGAKLVRVDQAVRRIRPGERIYLGAGSAVPLGLLDGLVAPDAPLGDNEIMHLLTLGPAPHVDPAMAERFRHNALFIGANVRQAVAEGRADYTPVFLSEIPGLMRSGRINVDVAMVSVTPPDADGYCSYGTHVDCAPAAVEEASLVIAEINPEMPWTNGPAKLHVDQIDAAVLSPHALPELPKPRARAETEAIARHIAGLIPDGATLQLGIGGVPDEVLHFLEDRHDLGIHTEMFSDGVAKLIERGVINGRCKTLHPNKVIASFVMGSQSTYDFLDRHPMIELHPVDYVNDPNVIAQNDNMVAINTCLQVDLTGQVCSDSIGSQFYSGIGGQVDFIRGAARSKGGRPIIAVPSTARGGVISRIVPRLDDGAGVVTTRGDVHWVVTEYGAVNLHGLRVRERAMALITIAHPKFRAWLLAEAKRLSFIYSDQLEPPIHAPLYPIQLETTIRTRDGGEMFLRAIKPTDEVLLRDMFYRLSQDSIYERFFAVKTTMPHAQLQRFCTIDYDREMTIVAAASRAADAEVVGWASYSVDPETGLAEAAFVVDDNYQGRGIGTALMRRLTEIAEARGVRGFTAEVLASNARMLAVFGKCGYPVERVSENATIHLRISFEQGRSAWNA